MLITRPQKVKHVIVVTTPQLDRDEERVGPRHAASRPQLFVSLDFKKRWCIDMLNLSAQSQVQALMTAVCFVCIPCSIGVLEATCVYHAALGVLETALVKILLFCSCHFFLFSSLCCSFQLCVLAQIWYIAG